MTIQLNADKSLTIHEGFGDQIKDLLTEELSRFTEHISRLEVHLSDENGSKPGLKDKRCMIEARLQGRQPIAVTALNSTYELAVNNAVDKLTTSMDTIFGRMKAY
ncbi:HPF/RaiA family ribosome-associated protein [soil metagenome]